MPFIIGITDTHYRDLWRIVSDRFDGAPEIPIAVEDVENWEAPFWGRCERPRDADGIGAIIDLGTEINSYRVRDYDRADRFRGVSHGFLRCMSTCADLGDSSQHEVCRDAIARPRGLR